MGSYSSRPCGSPANGATQVFMDGHARLAGDRIVRRETSCVVIAFLAPRSLRLERIISRGRSDDSPEAFEERDIREIKYGAAIPIALADEYILNTSTMENALGKIDAIIENERKSHN